MFRAYCEISTTSVPDKTSKRTNGEPKLLLLSLFLFDSLERGLKEKIPEIQEVMQSMPQGPPLEQEQVDIVLDGVRPFLEVVGGSIDMDRIEGVDSLQPTIWLHMQGNSASLNSVKLEIAQRLQRHFMMSGLQIQWKE